MLNLEVFEDLFERSVDRQSFQKLRFHHREKHSERDEVRFLIKLKQKKTLSKNRNVSFSSLCKRRVRQADFVERFAGGVVICNDDKLDVIA